MKSSLLLRAAQAIKAHVPMIKFRKGQHLVTSAAKPPISKSDPVSVSKVQQFVVIPEEHLPYRFRRQLLDESQISAINSGGCI